MPEQEQSWNEQIIAEFRANGGQVGGQFEGTPMLLLHHVGRRSGEARVNPMVFHDLGGGPIAVFASNAGRPHHPAWYLNLTDAPTTVIEVGPGRRDVVARTATGDERTEIWERQKAESPGFAVYEQATDREIPVVILDPA